MTQKKGYCTGCSALLAIGDRFCGSCGKEVTAPVENSSLAVEPQTSPAASPQITPAQPVPAAFSEMITGIIPSVSRKKGLLSVEAFNIIVTQKRMIFAVMTNDMINEEAKRVSKDAGFFGGILAAANVGYTYYKRYLEIAPGAAMAESPQNFAIDLSRIRKVKIEAGNEIKNYQTIKANRSSIIKQHQYENGRLEIETTNETYRFALPNSSLELANDIVRKAGLL